MIISHKYKFIFIKTAKTAGTSIEVFLSQHCAVDDCITPIWPTIEQHRPRNYQGLWNPFPEIIDTKGRGISATVRNLLKRRKYFNHIPATLVKHRTSRKIWNSYFKFCVDRNPWDKTLSHYHHENARTLGGLSFDKYLERGDFCVNYTKYCDPKGQLLVDKVIKYESLMDELAYVFQELNVPFEGSLGLRAKSEYRKDKRPYQEVFATEQQRMIKMAFKKEIDMHGYIF